MCVRTQRGISALLSHTELHWVCHECRMLEMTSPCGELQAWGAPANQHSKDCAGSTFEALCLMHVMTSLAERSAD